MWSSFFFAKFVKADFIMVKLKKLLKSFEESTNSFSQVSSPLNQNETTKEFLNRTNIVNKETEIYV